MKKSLFQYVIIALIAVASFACTQQKQSTTNISKNAKMSFIEIGSDKCIPCRQMQSVLQSLRTKYSKQLNVIFFDIYKNKNDIAKYNVTLIPTQIIIDSTGKEILRHQGYFPEKEIDTFLINHGIKTN